MTKVTIVWLRQDLRLEDNPALYEACSNGAVILLYIYPKEQGEWGVGSASKWWLHHSLLALQKQLIQCGTDLVVRQGDPIKVLKALIKQTGAAAVYWNRRVEPESIAADKKITSVLKDSGIDVQTFNGSLLYEPWKILNRTGNPFQVFTPFWKQCLATSLPTKPFPKPKKIQCVPCSSENVYSLKLLPKIHWDSEFSSEWVPGEVAAKKRLNTFLTSAVSLYKDQRDFPAIDGVSMLSPHLHFGELSPRMIWAEVVKHFGEMNEGTECFLRQLGWREFAHHLLFHFPKTPTEPLRQEFMKFPWKNDDRKLHAWQKGITGYPIVDAGMRQLWRTGWMHNRVRMIVGSFLVKDLMISWTEGARWFWDTLLDADLANNTLGWQWIGGCGADAAPYFRVFNPMLQGEKFDAEGDYIRKWVPELENVPSRWIHAPWEAPPIELKMAGVVLGKDYPYPIVDHQKARVQALNAFQGMRKMDE